MKANAATAITLDRVSKFYDAPAVSDVSLEIAGGARVRAHFDLVPMAPPPEPQAPAPGALPVHGASLTRTLAWTSLVTGGVLVGAEKPEEKHGAMSDSIPQ